MNQKLQVYSSNAINKHGFRMAVSALEGGQWDNAVTGIPAHVGHDMHKLIGWSFPFGLYIEYGSIRSLGKMIMPDDFKTGIPSFIKARNIFFGKRIQDHYKQYESAFIPLIKKHLSGDEKYFSKDVFSCRDYGLVQKVFPALKSRLDKNGLVHLDDILANFDYHKRGIFKSKDSELAILVHPSFRRSFSYYNSVHATFIEEFFSLMKRDDLKLRIALDWDCVGYMPSYSPMEELDYWWGPKFDNDISKIPLGLTRHEGNELEKTYYGISATEFLWKADGVKREFELEELRESPAPLNNDTYKCRYVHSIFDTGSSTFEHFDGATRSYHGDSYLRRISSKLTEAGKQSDYEKLFRIDGKLDLDSWKSLVTNYLQGNPLIYEYFGMEKPIGTRPVDTKPLSVKSELVPYSMDKGDDVRIFLSYHPKNNDNIKGHAVTIVDSCVRKDLTVEEVVEYDILELSKLFSRKGKTLIIPEGLKYSATEDRYWNIPCIFHGFENPQAEVDFTFDCLNEIFEKLNQKPIDLVVSFTIAWNEQDKEIRLSVMGHISDIVTWMNESPKVETNREKLRDWLDLQEERGKGLEKHRALMVNKPFLEEVCEFDGVLYMARQHVQQEYDVREEKEGLMYSMKFEKSDMKIEKAIKKGKVSPVATYYVQEATCSKSGLPYHESPYIRFIDDGVHMIISKCDFNGLIWTDKSKF